MRNITAEAFNRKASSSKSKPDEIIKALGLEKGQSIADIGAGGGYFSIRFAEIVGADGKVYAIDVNKNFLDFIKNSAIEKGIENLETMLSKDGKIDLPKKNIDLIFFRNVTHHIKNRTDYFSRLKHFLSPKGMIAIIEYKKKNSFTFHGIFKHSVAKEVLTYEMEKAGYFFDREFDLLPEQYFMIYRCKGEKR